MQLRGAKEQLKFHFSVLFNGKLVLSGYLFIFIFIYLGIVGEFTIVVGSLENYGLDFKVLLFQFLQLQINSVFVILLI
jgi:hypothetical protein